MSEQWRSAAAQNVEISVWLKQSYHAEGITCQRSLVVCSCCCMHILVSLSRNICSDADGLMNLKDACARYSGEKIGTLEGVRRAC